MRNRFFLAAVSWAAIFFPLIASAASENAKLPYEAGQKFVVVQGYNVPPTHINKDLFALDLSQNGCDAHGKFAVAAVSGQVMLAQESGYNGGYGTQVLVVNDNHIVTRYAHLIPGTIPVSMGDAVQQGEPLGEIGNTGRVAGAACQAHPGTHLHFAMYGQTVVGGSFSPFFPEPISGYRDIKAGKWYLSDNSLALATIPGVTAIIARAVQGVVDSASGIGDGAAAGNGASGADPVTNPAINPGITTAINIPVPGGVSATPPPPPAPPSSSPDSPQQVIVPAVINPATTPTVPTATVVFNTSTPAINLRWPAMQSASGSPSGTIYHIFKIDPLNASNTTPIGETTDTFFSYALSVSDFGTHPQFVITGGPSTIQTIPLSLPEWFANKEIQPVDSQNSNGSWYSDNWYNLGNGFYGTILSLTLEGSVNNSDYFASRVWLEEYLDKNYTQLNQTFKISDNAPFTNGMQKITIGGLNIALQPNKYYRLWTYQTYQNRSVILAGTAATGTAMWNEFIPGTGKVEHRYSFYPYLAAVMIPNYPPLMPPGAPAAIGASFYTLSSMLHVSWGPATDPDTTSSLLTYQVNIATSTIFDDAQWQPVGQNFSVDLPVVFGNSYRIGVRAVDDSGNAGAPISMPWYFPPGYVQVPQQLDHSVRLPGGGQKITLAATTTVNAIILWVEPLNGDESCCNQSFISLRSDSREGIGDEIASTTPILLSRFGLPGETGYSFPSPVTLSPGAYWLLFNKGPSSRTNDTIIDGSPGDSYPDGVWSSRTGQDAYFRIEQASGP